jgi:hypothetical protein
MAAVRLGVGVAILGRTPMESVMRNAAVRERVEVNDFMVALERVTSGGYYDRCGDMRRWQALFM